MKPVCCGENAYFPHAGLLVNDWLVGSFAV